MITFDSPEGATLRALNPSRAAVVSLWFTALNEGRDGWGSWAAEELKTVANDPELIALRFMQVASDGDSVATRQLWAVLASFPTEGTQSKIILAARELHGELIT